MNKKEFFIFVLSVALGFIACFVMMNRKGKRDDSQKVIELLTDSLHKVRDSLGREIVSLEVINADAERSIASIERILHEKEDLNLLDKQRLRSYKSRLTEALQENLEKDLEIDQLTVMANQTNVVIKEVPVVVRDTIRDGNKQHFFKSVYREPNDWFNITADIYLYDDKVDYTVNFKNEFSILQYKEGDRSFIRVRNNNPYTSTFGGEVFQLQQPKLEKRPKRWGLGLHLGMNYKLEPTLSVGINYDLIRF